MLARALLDAIVVLALLVCVFYLFIHRPSQFLARDSLQVNGWVYFGLVVAARYAVSYTLNGTWDDPAPNDTATWLSVALGALGDVILFGRLADFMYYRNHERDARQ